MEMREAKKKKKQEIEILQSNYTDKAGRFDWSQLEKKCKLCAITGTNLIGEIMSTEIQGSHILHCFHKYSYFTLH